VISLSSLLDPSDQSDPSDPSEKKENPTFKPAHESKNHHP
jgi:hypothetical protein